MPHKLCVLLVFVLLFGATDVSAQQDFQLCAFGRGEPGVGCCNGAKCTLADGTTLVYDSAGSRIPSPGCAVYGAMGLQLAGNPSPIDGGPNFWACLAPSPIRPSQLIGGLYVAVWNTPCTYADIYGFQVTNCTAAPSDCNNRKEYR